MTDDGGASPQGGTNDGPTLREVANRCCKRIDVGAAVLPRPLFDADYDDACGRGEAKIAGATIDPASGDAAAECPLPDPSASPSCESCDPWSLGPFSNLETATAGFVSRRSDNGS